MPETPTTHCATRLAGPVLALLRRERVETGLTALQGVGIHNPNASGSSAKPHLPMHNISYRCGIEGRSDTNSDPPRTLQAPRSGSYAEVADE